MTCSATIPGFPGTSFGFISSRRVHEPCRRSISSSRRSPQRCWSSAAPTFECPHRCDRSSRDESTFPTRHSRPRPSCSPPASCPVPRLRRSRWSTINEGESWLTPKCGAAVTLTYGRWVTALRSPIPRAGLIRHWPSTPSGRLDAWRKTWLRCSRARARSHSSFDPWGRWRHWAIPGPWPRCSACG